MGSPPIIAVISALATDHQVRTYRLPDPGESLIASGLFIRCGGKGANTCVAAARLSRKNPAKKSNQKPATLANELPNSKSNTADDASIEGTLPPEITGLSTSSVDVPLQVRMVGAVGYDDRRGGIDMRGMDLINQLRENGVDTTGVRAAHGKQTGLCTGIVDTETGENRLLITPGANLHLQPNDFLTLESLAGGYRPDLVVCNLVIPRETTEQILETASSNGISTLLNPSPAQYLLRPVYRMVSHLILNETEAAMMTDMPVEEVDNIDGCAKATDKFLKMGVGNVVITLGAKGAYYSNVIGQGSFVEAEKDVNVVDATGAGYEFSLASFSIFLVHCLARFSLRYSCRFSPFSSLFIVPPLALSFFYSFLKFFAHHEDMSQRYFHRCVCCTIRKTKACRALGYQESCRIWMQSVKLDYSVSWCSRINPVVR